jgi:hypothetical protein
MRIVTMKYTTTLISTEPRLYEVKSSFGRIGLAYLYMEGKYAVELDETYQLTVEDMSELQGVLNSLNFVEEVVNAMS